MAKHIRLEWKPGPPSEDALRAYTINSSEDKHCKNFVLSWNGNLPLKRCYPNEESESFPKGTMLASGVFVGRSSGLL